MTDITGIFDEAPECTICHTHRRDASLRLTHFIDDRYATVIRCRDSYRCWQTVKDGGREWPLASPTDATFREAQ